MDPDANLEEQMQLAREIIHQMENGWAAISDEAHRLAELVLALDEWIKKGGFMPKEWRR